MGCVTGKRQYDTQSQAEEALIETRGRFVFREGSGPIDVYQCDDCGYWHFTSKGTVSDLLKKADTKKQISDQQEAQFWERKFRSR
ncbi:hypothetical protein [Marinoscillum sp. 108]|jgi:hypothetical protein|uniref:Uncharacterized protein n=1 Tax=Marinoscillum luteum TaxID=861051 RepID=A0ABW7N5F8_9BACT|nr:hypothetical protein [Marinoscillum sp. 108]VXD10778.1 conserved hypothetical protein [Marinoscillum sp. 108]